MALALYRTYRPGRFADVVGQEHVTGPLVRAIEKGRLHHAYLFSGPRGCGKTSSARILARSLNCESGPTAEPCGVCRSCVDLAPNGPGSLDVVEMDAATHGLVDDARELRERAHFAPVSSRYKIYIIDEAHQLGPGAANALLKIIEEPPAHVRFVFATTAPDKILPTIRSRTHHYPFRLVPARLLQQHLAWICEQEGVAAEPTALDLVARAGAGSVRDALSVLGQLMAGAGDDGVTYALAYEQLGFTDAALLDQVVTALAGQDASVLFHAVDRVVDTGHDPRRFLVDLLERLRDLLLVQTVDDALESGLVSAPDDQAARMRAQAAAFGRADLVRCAHVADEGVLSMRGTTPTRLQLELVCSRLLLPGSDAGLADLHARVDRMERTMLAGGVPERPGTNASAARGERAAPPAPELVTPAPGREPADAGAPGAGAIEGPAPATPKGEASGIAEVRRVWPEVLERLRELRKTPWTFIKDTTEPIDITDDVLVLGVRSARLRDTLIAREDYTAYLHQAVTEVLGRSLRVEAVVKPGQGDDEAGGSGSPPRSPQPKPSRVGGSRAQASPAQASRLRSEPQSSQPAASQPGPSQAGAPQPGSSQPRPSQPRASQPRASQPRPSPTSGSTTEKDSAAADDEVLDDLSSADLLSRELGARVIDVLDED